MTGSGHIAGVVNPPRSKKYQFWTGGKPVGDFDDMDGEGHRNARFVVAALAEMDREAGRPAREGEEARQGRQGAGRRAGHLCEGSRVTLCDAAQH